MEAPKKIKIPTSSITRDLDSVSAPTGNIYESLVVISKRAKQISTHTKEELNAKLKDFAVPVGSLVELFENQEQIEISRYYERLPKPTNIAIDQFLKNELFYRRNDQEDSPDESETL